ncbi:hypothetical protein C8R43DRAFT_907065 [Mycena crocata]|nr:hypothetical protein C8R43DRAFT_907065 [Mycena crocata]
MWLFWAKGANILIPSATPNNVWATGTLSYSASRFLTSGEDAAAATGAIFVDHGISWNVHRVAVPAARRGGH